MKLGIVIICYNLDSRIFILQMDAIKRFCKDDYTIEIIDNSTDPKKATDIKYHAEIRNLKYTRTYSVNLNGSESHVFAASLSYNLLKDKYDYFFYCDHDVIPLSDFSIIEILGEKYMGGLGQEKNGVIYFWQGLCFWNNNKVEHDLIDFSTNSDLELDSGGNLYKVIEKYGKENCVFVNEEYEENKYYHGKYNYYSLLNDGMFLHCVGASAWNEMRGNEERINSLVNILKEKLNVD